MPDPIQSTAPVAPDPSTVAPQGPMPSLGAAPAPPSLAAATPTRPSIWSAVVTGALQGLAGSAGATHFGGGLAGGAANVLAQKQLAVENQRAQTAQDSSIKFQSAQAAQSVAEATRNNAVAAALPQEAADAHGKSQLEMAQSLQAMGITPTVIADDTHAGATAGLQSLTQSQGAVPHLFNLEVGGQHLAYDLTQLSGAPQGLTLINNARDIQGLPPLTAGQWRQTPKPAQAQTAEGALKFFAPPPSKSLPEAEGKLSQYQGWLKAYSMRPDADPVTTAKVQSVVDNLTGVRDGIKKDALLMASQDAYKKSYAQKQARNDVDKADYQASLADGDVTGWKPDPKAFMSEQQYNAANTKFVSGDYAKAQDVEKSYQTFEEAYNNRNSAPTGAGSMVALANHLGNSMAGIKGGRATSDIIHAHQDAAGVADRLQVMANKLTTGSVLAENQWNDFRGLIKKARDLTWTNAINNAHGLGVPIKDGMLPSDVTPAKSGSAPAKQTNKYSDLGAIPAN